MPGRPSRTAAILRPRRIAFQRRPTCLAIRSRPNRLLAAGVPFPPGEAEAARRLEAFLAEKIGTYGADRDRLDRAGTSALSPYLRFGMLSARQAVAAAGEPGARSRMRTPQVARSVGWTS